jgi:ABC-type phosphate transport system substrate-binding protein
VFAYNLSIGGQRVTNLRLSGAVIAGIFTNQITMWNDQRIAADNPGLTLPAVSITPVVRSDGDGATGEFTQWMNATEGSYWTAYCQAVGLNPCARIFNYPVQSGTAMVSVPGDTGVSAYVAQPQVNGTIGYTVYSSALAAGLPVAKVLNAAGYYTAPTAGNVGVSLLDAQIDTNPSDPLYLTADLSQVYTDPDPRTYELSYYSYMIVPTDTSFGFTTDKGYALGAFGQFLLCQGQQQVNVLGYSALPINLVEAGFAQLQKVPGASVPTATSAILASCDNPTFSSDGTNTLANEDPMPPACDKQGPAQCAANSPVNTTTTLTATPSPALAGQTVTLAATVVCGTGNASAGTVQFQVSDTALGAPVALDPSGVAIVTTTFAGAGTEALSAVFTPAVGSTCLASVGTASLTVLPPMSLSEIPLAVTDPVTGTFSLTVNTTDTVTLTVTGNDATAATTPIVVSDTRNTFPGWSVSGQVADFAGSGTAAGASILGNQLGWMPTETSVGTGVSLGGTVTPGAPGLGTTSAVLALAHAGSGYGTSTLAANLTLALPAETAAGDYTSGLTVNAITALP